MEITQEEVKTIFKTWQKDYREHPETFENVTMDDDSYSEACTKYFFKVLDKIKQ